MGSRREFEKSDGCRKGAGVNEVMRPSDGEIECSTLSLSWSRSSLRDEVQGDRVQRASK